MSKQQLALFPRLISTDAELRLWGAIEGREPAPGQPVVSLFQVAVEAGINYAWAYRCLARLEIQGLVRVVRRGPGRPMEIYLC